MSIDKESNLETQRIGHSGNAPDGLQELPVNIFDNTSLNQAVQEGLIKTPDTPESIAHPEGWEPSVDSTPNKKPRYTRRQKAIAGLAAAAVVIGGGFLVKAGVDTANQKPTSISEGPGTEVPVIPLPGDPDYDYFAEISSSNNLAIGDVDRILGYFTSPEVSRDALIQALSQASQQEIDRILEVVDDYGSSNNDEVTTILNKYGLVTSEVPVNPLGRITENNDITEQEATAVAIGRYPDIAYDDIVDALKDFSQSEIDVVRAVLNGSESSIVLNGILQDHGVVLGDGYIT